jgi:23S rRNA pseudouridine2605 synthase
MLEKDEKIQKVMARLGLCSRREAERWIEEGRVSVNGSIIGLGTRVTSQDKVRVDGKLQHTDLHTDIKRRVIIYYKPEGEVCTRKDEQDRATVFDRLPSIKIGRWIMIGRLDINTSGLLLFTNDGELANRLMHPSHEIDRVYAVRVMGEVTQQMIQRLQRGVVLEDGEAKFDKIKSEGGQGINSWYHVTLKEGRNREVRRLWESQDVQVSRLIRLKYGEIELPKRLPRGAWEELDGKTTNNLARSVGLEGQKTKQDFRKKTRRQRVMTKIKHSHKSRKSPRK